jgi:phage/plasmid-like protein (TIGR03299 family)
MPALFDKGFFVREPAWHGMGIVLDDYPNRETAMELAGHNFDVALRPIGHLRRNDEGALTWRELPGYKEHFRSDDGITLAVHSDSFEPIQNSTAYEVAELLFDQGFQYETGITLDSGKTCAITLKLDEPVTISGDNSITLPFGCLSWSHDGSGSLRVRSGTIRQVCANTVAASEAEGKRLKTDFTFRHTKNVKDRIEDAKAAIKGVRANLDVYVKVMEELAALPVTPEQRDLFVSTIIGDRDGLISSAPSASDRVKANVERERVKVLSLFNGPTVPESISLTGYGLFQAGGEYFDHLRNFRTQDSYVKRTLLSDNPAKANLARTIREIVAA